jgi:hypothetical protein
MPRYDLAGNPIEDDPPPNAQYGQPFSQPYGQPPAFGQAPGQPPAFGQAPGQPPPYGQPPPTYGQAPGSMGVASPPPVYGAPQSYPGQAPYGGGPGYGQPSWPPTPSNAPPSGYSYNPFASNSSGTQGDVPVEIDRLKWNWGAFMFNRFWVYYHGMSALGSILWVSFLGLRLVHLVMPGPLGSGFVCLYWLANFGVSVYLGMNGHRMAWRNRRFDSIQQYFAVQRAWMIGGFVLWGVGLFFILLGVFAVVAAQRTLSTMPHASPYGSGYSSGYNSGRNSGSNTGSYGGGSDSSDGSDTSGSSDPSSGATPGGSGTGTGSTNSPAPIQGFAPTNNNGSGN